MSVKFLKREKRILFFACAGAIVLITCILLRLADHPVLLRYEQAELSFETEDGRITRVTIGGRLPYGVVYGRPEETEENRTGGPQAEIYVMEADFSLFMKSSMNLDLRGDIHQSRTIVFRFADRELMITNGEVVEER